MLNQVKVNYKVENVGSDVGASKEQNLGFSSLIVQNNGESSELLILGAPNLMIIIIFLLLVNLFNVTTSCTHNIKFLTNFESNQSNIITGISIHYEKKF